MQPIDAPAYDEPGLAAEKTPVRLSRFAVYTWIVLSYNLAVILWGAYVRASGSGAGCGSHWPLCNGEVLPRGGQVATIIEFTHRLTSGVALLLVIGMVFWAWRRYPRKHLVRWGAGSALFFILTEAMIGAGLVLFEYVADNASFGRGLFLAVHLANTFILLAAIALTAWWASRPEQPHLRGQGAVVALLGVGLIGTLLLGVSGAVAALGDTLFPVSSLAEGIRQDLSPTAHILIRLRLVHPLLAFAVGIYLILATRLSAFMRPAPTTKWLSVLTSALVLIQLGVGVLNVSLLAPIWLQLVHLLLADLLWLALVLLCATILAHPVGRHLKASAA